MTHDPPVPLLSPLPFPCIHPPVRRESICEGVDVNGLSVARLANGWFVKRDGQMIAGPFRTNAEAWRALDRFVGEPISKSEDTASWRWGREVHGE